MVGSSVRRRTRAWLALTCMVLLTMRLAVSGAATSTTLARMPAAPQGSLQQSTLSQDTSSYAAPQGPTSSHSDIILSKFDEPDPVLAGDPLTYTLVAENTGPSSSANVSLVDNLPDEVEFASASFVKLGDEKPCAYEVRSTGQTVICDFGFMAVNDVITATIVVTPTMPGMTGNQSTITNQATTEAVNDNNKGNNDAEAVTTVLYATDLAIEKSAEPEVAEINEPLTYTLDVSNHGPLTGTNVIVTDTLPLSTTFASVSHEEECAYNEADHEITCNFAELPTTDTLSITIVVTPTTTGVITNTASVSSGDHPNRVAVNDSDTVVTTVIEPMADLTISKEASADEVAVGAPLTYTLGVLNSGPFTATNVTISDTLPLSTTFASVSPGEGCLYDEAAHAVSCDVAELAIGENVTVTVVLTPTEAGVITNTADVWSADLPDPIEDDNTDTVTTTVSVGSDLSISKEASAAQVAVGQPITYTLTVTNNDAVTATNVVIADTLPVSTTFASSTPGAQDCLYEEAEHTVRCEVAELAGSESVTVTVVVTPTESGVITNTAAVWSADLPDPIVENNTDAVTTTVVGGADLAVTKEASTDQAYVGSPFTYTIALTNNGPLTATNVTISDTLPLSMTLASISSSAGQCGGSEAITCTLDVLGAGEVVTVTLVVTPTAEGTFTNTVSVSSDILDPVLDNNTASVTTEVELRRTFLPLVVRD